MTKFAISCTYVFKPFVVTVEADSVEEAEASAKQTLSKMPLDELRVRFTPMASYFPEDIPPIESFLKN